MDQPAENDPRVYFAAERTFLAWIRTGLGLMASASQSAASAFSSARLAPQNLTFRPTPQSFSLVRRLVGRPRRHRQPQRRHPGPPSGRDRHRNGRLSHARPLRDSTFSKLNQDFCSTKNWATSHPSEKHQSLDKSNAQNESKLTTKPKLTSPSDCKPFIHNILQLSPVYAIFYNDTWTLNQTK